MSRFTGPKAIANLAFGGISANTVEKLPVTVGGARVGDFVFVSSRSLQEDNLVLNGWVSADDTVQVQAGAIGTITNATADYCVRVVPKNDFDSLSAIVRTFTIDFGDPANNASLNTTVTVPNAEVGDMVFVQPVNAPEDGTWFQGWVSAADTVTVQVSTFGTVADMASNDYTVAVLKSPTI